MHRQLILVIFNISLNLLLIPHYGAIGAAIATVLSDLIVGLFLDGMNKSTKYLFYMKIDALFFTKVSRRWYNENINCNI